MKTAADYRIEDVKTVFLDGKKVKAFNVFVKQGHVFVFIGAYTAPAKTAAKNLWLIPNESDTGATE